MTLQERVNLALPLATQFVQNTLRLAELGREYTRRSIQEVVFSQSEDVAEFERNLQLRRECIAHIQRQQLELNGWKQRQGKHAPTGSEPTLFDLLIGDYSEVTNVTFSVRVNNYKISVDDEYDGVIMEEPDKPAPKETAGPEILKQAEYAFIEFFGTEEEPSPQDLISLANVLQLEKLRMHLSDINSSVAACAPI